MLNIAITAWIIDDGQIEPALENLLKLEPDRRSIMGYIVVDHPGTYFFDDGLDHNIDVDIGYMYADMLSMALLVVKNFMEYSESVSEYRVRLNTEGDTDEEG